jgi:site-specific DNA recombinase
MGKSTAKKRSARSYNAVQFDRPYILFKLIHCPQCGAGRLREGANKTYGYSNEGHFHTKGTSVCTSNSINANVTEQ